MPCYSVTKAGPAEPTPGTTQYHLRGDLSTAGRLNFAESSLRSFRSSRLTCLTLRWGLSTLNGGGLARRRRRAPKGPEPHARSSGLVETWCFLSVAKASIPRQEMALIYLSAQSGSDSAKPARNGNFTFLFRDQERRITYPTSPCCSQRTAPGSSPVSSGRPCSTALYDPRARLTPSTASRTGRTSRPAPSTQPSWS